MPIRADLGALLRGLWARLRRRRGDATIVASRRRLRSDPGAVTGADRLPPPPAANATNDGAPDDARLQALRDDVRSWAEAMAWTPRASRDALDFVMTAAEGRIESTFGPEAAPEQLERLRALCRAEAWRVIMDIRRAA